MTTTDQTLAAPTTDQPDAVDDDGGSPDSSPSQEGADSGPTHRGRSLLIAALLYLGLAVFVWWNVWSTHPTSTTTCGCGDSSLFTWFLAWPAYALSHGLNPLYSTYLFHPTGVNLLSNTAEVGIGVVLAPITWLFGPIATLNVALTLSPALSALAMYILLQRWVTWAPAAFFGGLVYGFSAFILSAITDAHLMLGMAFVPPLVVAGLDELLVRQKRRPVATGIVLGLLVFVQFFIGTEVLVIMAITLAIGLVLILLYGIRHPEVIRPRVHHAVVGVAAAVATSVVLLAYPVWFTVAGPAHLSGAIWGNNSVISYGGYGLKGYVVHGATDPTVTTLAHQFGGYQGGSLSGSYFGWGLVAVLVVGVVVWWRDRRLWLFGLTGVATVFLSVGLELHRWTLWRLFVRLPEMDNIIPSRFLLMTTLMVAVMFGVIVDHTYRSVGRWRATGGGSVGGSRQLSTESTGDRSSSRGRATVAGLAVAAIGVVPVAAYFATGLPFTATPVALPPWFRTVAPHLTGHQVILAFPVPFRFIQSSMTWQAVDGMSYAMVGGGGPASIDARAGAEAPAQDELGNVSVSEAPQAITPSAVTSVRQALDAWGVTMVVVPNPDHLPLYEQVRDVRSAAVLLTAATGQQPVYQEGAWVWSNLGHAGPAVTPTAAALAQCVAGPLTGSVVSIDRSTGCVLSSASPAS